MLAKRSKTMRFSAAKRPNLTAIQDKHPHGLISGSGEDVGLPDGQMGNSEVGHMNLGAGRVLYQDFTRITKDIRTGDFFEHRSSGRCGGESPQSCRWGSTFAWPFV